MLNNYHISSFNKTKLLINSPFDQIYLSYSATPHGSCATKLGKKKLKFMSCSLYYILADSILYSYYRCILHVCIKFVVQKQF